MSKEKTSYWNMKDDEIQSEIKARKLDYDLDQYSRKTAIESLKVSDVYLGKATEALEDDGENINETMAKKGYVKVRFFNTAEDETPYVFIGHNGKSYYIPKEEDVWVPKILLKSVIKDAVETRMESKKINGKIQQVSKQYQRFPYQLVDM